jgi:ArsR family transcriptional regulator
MNDKWSESAGCCPPPDPDALDGDPDERLARLAKALGHPARVKLLRVLIQREECVCGELCAELPLAQSTVSQHLKVLRDAGLVHGEIDGPRTCYCADTARLAQLRELLGTLLSPVRA